ncbi:TetR/AcrR family transcriptional regulator [Paenibacillus planticolens]|uniref:TetR family transcriptional regulator n=1 Tax=Paenibacillus planticolens TaxID=2654976 RepID=A0ABX1ZJW6_9BACL|nr:TetR/AcrR family transcriptional regulator [Paenibacillus planticolens]NOU98934.1 TetR family transcriptional regulator [Paenibacillus planticolens]
MSSNKQEEIYDAALKLFAERGYDGTTVPMIAETAAVGAGTIYRYFENKEALVNSLFQKVVTQFAETIKNDFPFSSTIREQFRHVFYQMVAFVKNNAYTLLFIDSHADAYYLNEKSQKEFQDFLSFLTAIVEEGKEQGVVSPLPANALICVVYGAFVSFFKEIQHGKLEESPELIAGIEKSCWNAIRAD